MSCTTCNQQKCCCPEKRVSVRGKKGDKGDPGKPGATGAPGAPGAPGADGLDGDQGIYGGFSQAFVFDTGTGAGPPITELRFNNANPTLVTAIYVSDINVDLQTSETFLNSFENNGNFGYVRVFKTTDSSKFWLGRVTAVSDVGASHTLTVTYLGWNGNGAAPFVDTDPVVITFTPAGPEGPSTPVTVLGASQSPSVALTANVPTSMFTAGVPVGDWLALGEGTLTMLDNSEVHYQFYVNGAPAGQERIIENQTGATQKVSFSIHEKLNVPAGNIQLYMWYVTAASTLEVVSVNCIETA